MNQLKGMQLLHN